MLTETATAPTLEYSVRLYPFFIVNHGNWDIYANKTGYCAAIPTEKARAIGCLASHFGTAEYVRKTLGVCPLSVIPQT